MIHPETMSEQIGFAERNIAHNLDFVPDHRLDWKPAEGRSRCCGGDAGRPWQCLTGATRLEAAVWCHRSVLGSGATVLVDPP